MFNLNLFTPSNFRGGILVTSMVFVLTACGGGGGGGGGNPGGGSNKPPVAQNTQFDVSSNMQTQQTLMASDPDDDPLTFSIIDPPIKGTASMIDLSTGSFLYTPNQAETGTDQITFMVSDGSAQSNLATVTINITEPSTDPSASADKYDVSEGGVLAVGADLGVAAGDTFPIGRRGDYRVKVVTPPGAGTLDMKADGSFSYQHDGREPVANDKQDTFRYRLLDDKGSRSNAVTVTLNILPTDDPPKPVLDNYENFISQGGTFVADTSLSVTQNDEDVDTDKSKLAVSLVRGPSFGTLTLNEDGTFTYVHDGSGNFQDNFVYKVSDGTTISQETATAWIRVSSQNAGNNNTPVVAPFGCMDVVRSVPATGTLRVVDPDQDPLTYNIPLVASGSKGTATIDENGTFTYTADPNGFEYGLDTFTVEIDDGRGGVTTDTITMNITPRVMPVGDSITEGVTAASFIDESGQQQFYLDPTDPTMQRREPIPLAPQRIGYRFKLKKSAASRGYPINFVGSRNAKFLETFVDPATGEQIHKEDGGFGYEVFADFQSEGHGGKTSRFIDEGIIQLDSGTGNPISGWLFDNPADIILLHIGTNDFKGKDPNPAVPSIANVTNILNKIDKFNPKAKVLVARIIGWNPDHFGTLHFISNDLITQFNDAVAADVATRDQSRYVSVDQFNALTYPDDIGDPVTHPAQSGYDKMATTWLNALESNGFIEKCPKEQN